MPYSPEELESFRKRITVSNQEDILPKSSIYHGAREKDARNIIECGIDPNKGDGVGGKGGLYVAEEIGKANDYAYKRAGKPVIMEGRFNLSKKYRIASIEIHDLITRVDLKNGRFPSNWSNDKTLQDLIHKNFDILEVRGFSRINSFGSDRVLVVYASAGKDAIKWHVLRQPIPLDRNPLRPTYPIIERLDHSILPVNKAPSTKQIKIIGEISAKIPFMTPDNQPCMGEFTCRSKWKVGSDGSSTSLELIGKPKVYTSSPQDVARGRHEHIQKTNPTNVILAGLNLVMTVVEGWKIYQNDPQKSVINTLIEVSCNFLGATIKFTAAAISLPPNVVTGILLKDLTLGAISMVDHSFVEFAPNYRPLWAKKTTDMLTLEALFNLKRKELYASQYQKFLKENMNLSAIVDLEDHFEHAVVLPELSNLSQEFWTLIDKENQQLNTKSFSEFLSMIGRKFSKTCKEVLLIDLPLVEKTAVKAITTSFEASENEKTMNAIEEHQNADPANMSLFPTEREKVENAEHKNECTSIVYLDLSDLDQIGSAETEETESEKNENLSTSTLPTYKKYDRNKDEQQGSKFWEGMQIVSLASGLVGQDPQGRDCYGLCATLKNGAKISIGIPEGSDPIGIAARTGGCIIAVSIPIGGGGTTAAALTSLLGGVAVGAVVAAVVYAAIKIYNHRQKHIARKISRQYEGFWKQSSENVTQLYSAIEHATQNLQKDTAISNEILQTVTNLNIENIWDKKEYALRHKKYGVVISYFMRENVTTALRNHFGYLAQHHQWIADANQIAKGLSIEASCERLCANQTSIVAPNTAYQNDAFIREIQENISKDGKSFNGLKNLLLLRELKTPVVIDTESLSNPRPPERLLFEFELFGKKRSEKLERVNDIIYGIAGISESHKALLHVLSSPEVTVDKKVQAVKQFKIFVNKHKSTLDEIPLKNDNDFSFTCLDYYQEYFNEIDASVDANLKKLEALEQTQSQPLIDPAVLQNWYLVYTSSLFREKIDILRDTNATTQIKLDALRDLVKASQLITTQEDLLNNSENDKDIRSFAQSIASRFKGKEINEERLEKFIDDDFRSSLFPYYGFAKNLSFIVLSDQINRYHGPWARKSMMLTQAVDRYFPMLFEDLSRYPEALLRGKGKNNIDALSHGIKKQVKNAKTALQNIPSGNFRLKDGKNLGKNLLDIADTSLSLLGVNPDNSKGATIISKSAKTANFLEICRKTFKYYSKNPQKMSNLSSVWLDLISDSGFGIYEIFHDDPKNILPAFSKYKLVDCLQSVVEKWSDPGNLPTDVQYYIYQDAIKIMLLPFIANSLMFLAMLKTTYYYYSGYYVEAALQAHVKNITYFWKKNDFHTANQRLKSLKETLKDYGYKLDPTIPIEMEGNHVRSIKIFICEYEIAKYFNKLNELTDKLQTTSQALEVSVTYYSFLIYITENEVLIPKEWQNSVEEFENSLFLKLMQIFHSCKDEALKEYIAINILNKFFLSEKISEGNIDVKVTDFAQTQQGDHQSVSALIQKKQPKKIAPAEEVTHSLVHQTFKKACRVEPLNGNEEIPLVAVVFDDRDAANGFSQALCATSISREEGGPLKVRMRDEKTFTVYITDAIYNDVVQRDDEAYTKLVRDSMDYFHN